MTAPHAEPLRRAASLMVIGNAGYAAFQWLMLMVLAHLGGKRAVGEFGLGLAIATPVVLLTSLSLRGVQSTDSKHEFSASDYVALRLVTSSAALATIAAISLAYTRDLQLFAVLALVGVSKTIEAFCDFTYGVFQQHSRFSLVARSLWLRGVGGLIGFAVALGIDAGLGMALAAQCATWLIVLVVIDLPAAGSLASVEGGIRPRWRAAVQRRLFWLALPLGLSAALASLAGNVPRYFVEYHLDTAALGVFVAFSYMTVAVSTVVNAIGQAAAPRLAAAWGRGDRAGFRSTVNKLLAIGLVVGLGGVGFSLIAGDPVIRLLFGAEFTGHQELFVIVMVSAAFSTIASLLGYAVTATRAYHLFLLPYAASTGAVVIVSALLVPEWGLRGAGITLVVGALAACVPPVAILAILKPSSP